MKSFQVEAIALPEIEEGCKEDLRKIASIYAWCLSEQGRKLEASRMYESIMGITEDKSDDNGQQDLFNEQQ